MSLLQLTIPLLVAVAFAASARADWPQHRGPERADTQFEELAPLATTGTLYRFVRIEAGRHLTVARLSMSADDGARLTIERRGPDPDCRGFSARERCRRFARTDFRVESRISGRAAGCFSEILRRHEFERTPPGRFASHGDTIWLIEERRGERYRWWANTDPVSPELRAIGGYFLNAGDCISHRADYGFEHLDDCLCRTLPRDR